MKNDSIDHGKVFDWGNTSKDYAKYRDIYPDEFYKKIVDLGLCVSGQQALDLGTGTGVLPRNMYHYGADWTGSDISENQIVEAVRMANEAGMKIRFIVAPAEKTSLPDHVFDVITACQCFFYFDKEKIVPEIVRMLRPNGRLLILFMSWLPFDSEIARESEELVLKYNPSWTGASFKRFEPKVPNWSTAYFDCVNCLAYDIAIPFTRESWHGRIVACRGIGASSLQQDKIDAFRKEHLEYMQTVSEQFEIPHYVTMLDLRAKTI